MEKGQIFLTEEVQVINVEGMREGHSRRDPRINAESFERRHRILALPGSISLKICQLLWWFLHTHLNKLPLGSRVSSPALECGQDFMTHSYGTELSRLSG